METGSEGESNKNNNGSPAEGSNRPKRLMKTPFQLETLEKTYTAEMYPSEVTRVELSERLGLSDRQLQMWFCHRRLKDKKEGVDKKALAAPVARKGLVGSSMDELKVVEFRSDGGLGSMSRSRSGSGQRRDLSQFYDDDDVSFVRRSPRSVMKQRVITCVETQLREPLREDGPILGIDFDELPPGAFGAPLVMTEHWGRSGNPSDAQIYERLKPSKIKGAMRSVCEPAEPSTRADAYRRSSSHYYDSPVDGPSLKIPSFMQGNGQFSRKYSAQVQVSSVGTFSHQAKQEQFSSTPKGNDSIPNTEDVMQIGRKRKSDEIRIGGEVSDEKRIRKELEKQDLLRRKREEQMRKEMEKQDRERRKEEERMFRENQRREEKYQREERRELERREKFLQKELLKAERMKQQEDLRRDKEAARKKVAMERAALRRIAKESLELIEDERLELMELAALSKGLPSIISLDYETLQNLESFRDSLCAFPPKSVQLKRPFSIKPWIDSEDNIGNLLMVWRFCITFSDVLGLWPFTLDEFVQAFHDYDSRLLTEIHIALLKLIIKDIEEGARTPCGGSGTNHYTVANPDGGHPQIVEGAFVWGFDIRNWQNHLNPLTWPEILRQFALSAGFGPQLRKESTELAGLRDNNEVKGCEDNVSMLRNGSAVENAVAVMQAKRFSLQQRSRHRLTPGTVKFAAYHVLCLEGSKGQTVLELADKIQKFGLRDLSKSKTPDASVSVALSRDPILFERIAPSTYCVRPAFRKDPANAEVILEAAREKIQKYGNGFLAEETVDDPEKDDNSESDVAEGPEIDELGTPSNVNKTSDHYIELGTLSGNANDISCDDVTLNLKNDLDTTGHSINQVCITGKDAIESDPGQGFTEIDESKSGEPWVQGLTEGEYCDLCVEERLNALVALIGVVNEGNTIRAVLEDRLDAANALKKQMWTEAQLGKRRMKEESSTKFHNSSLTAAADGSQSPLIVENRNNEVTLNTAANEEPSVDPDNVQKDHDHFSSMASERSLVVHDTSITQITLPIKHDRSKSERSRLQLKSFIGHRAEEMHVYRSLPLGQDRRRNRYWQFVASASRHDPGSGRIFVELRDGYWKLIDSTEAFDALLMSLDTRGLGESHLHIMLQQSETSFKENVRRNLQCFDIVGETGTRVKNEATELGSCTGCVVGSKSPSSALFGSNSDMWEPSSSFRIELGKNETEKMNAFKRYQALQAWMWKQCFNSSTLCAMTNGRKGFAPLLGICDYCRDSFNFEENKCPSCHRTFSTFGNRLNYLESGIIQCEEKNKVDTKNLIVSDSFPFQIRLIKALLAFLEVSVPSEAFQSFWTAASRRSWGLKLQSSSSIGDLLQILTQFEGVIKRDFLSSDFETTTELLGSCAFSGKAVTESDGSVPQLPWIPQTTAAVALRLLELDSSIFRTPNQKSETHNATEVENFTKLPSRYRYVKDVRKDEPTESPEDELTKPGNWAGLGTIRGSSRRRRVVRNRCGAHPSGRSQKKNHSSRSESARRSIKVKKTSTQVLMQQGERTQRQIRGNGHGRGTVRRRRENKAVEEMLLGHYDVHLGIRESPRNSAGEWVGEEIGKMQDEDADHSNSSSESESDGNVDATRYEDRRREPSFTVASNRSTWDMMEMSDEDADVRDINGSVDHDNLEEDVNMNDGSVGNSDESSDTSGDHSD